MGTTLEHLRVIRSDIEKLNQGQANIHADLRALKSHFVGMAQSLVAHDDHFAQIETRLDRIEKRLDLVDAQ
jgi:predicted  nucleic acid-binding Zn-ribbon protein